ncbi:MAG: hypothetical protein R3327_01300 [Nitrosopumilaceae archaeon]|nr:hypothetical protein [Nitrosopumilaceae archaeon]
MIFSKLVEDLQNALKKDLAQIRFLLKKNPAMAYTRIVEVGEEVGRKHNIKLIVNFPHEGKIEQFDLYGKRDLSLIIDREKKNFPIEREIIKKEAKKIFGDVKVEDAYMYEGKEGVRVYAPGGKIDILPHSLHIWTLFDDNVTTFCNWLMSKVYEIQNDQSSSS